jgi:hypothetical protein
MEGTAHQRLIRESLAQQEPRAVAASLQGYSVETIGREQASPLIMRYEWLGSMGRTTIFTGLLSPARELQGVICYADNPANWRTTRSLRRPGRRMTFEQARARGWQIATREAKHVYADARGERTQDMEEKLGILLAIPFASSRVEIEESCMRDGCR